MLSLWKLLILCHVCRLVNDSFEELHAFHLALREYVGNVDPSYYKEHHEFFIGLEGSFGAKHVTPRTLLSHFLGNMVCVEGIVTKCKLLSKHWDIYPFVVV